MESKKISRQTASYTRTNQRFIVRSGARTFGLQFSQLYTRRIAELRPLALKAAAARWVSTDSTNCEFLTRRPL